MKKIFVALIALLVVTGVVFAGAAIPNTTTTVTNTTTTYSQPYPNQANGVPFLWSSDIAFTAAKAAGAYRFDIPLASIAGGASRWVDIAYNRGNVSAVNGADTTSTNITVSVSFGLSFGQFDLWYPDSTIIAAAGNEGNAFSTQSATLWNFAKATTGIGSSKFPANTNLVDSLVVSHVDTGATNSGYTWTKTYVPRPFNKIRVSLTVANPSPSVAHLRLGVLALPGAPMAGITREPTFPATKPK